MRHEPSPLATGPWPNEARGPENDTAPTDPSKSATVELRLKHVLVVDDDPALRAMVQLPGRSKCQGQHGF